MSTFGPSRRFAAAQQFSRFQSEADIEPDFMSARPSSRFPGAVQQAAKRSDALQTRDRFNFRNEALNK
jgi:hypothetical protein